MRNLCIIPARGGSKRIPRKNIKDFLGKPIIAYSIEVARRSNLFDTIMVSTDDEEIAQVSRRLGADIPFMRSKEAASDGATTAVVILEVLKEYSQRGDHFDNICCLYATAPLVSINALRQGYDTLLEGYDSVFPVVAFSFPIWRGLKFNDSHRVEMLWPEYMMSRSQDLTPAYHDAGQWYWLKATSFEKNQILYPLKSQGVVLDELFVQDIDSVSDWSLAEMKFKLIQGATSVH